VGGHVSDVQPSSGVFQERQDIEPVAQGLSRWKKSTAMIAWAWLVWNCLQVGPQRRGAGSIACGVRNLSDDGGADTVAEPG
jgi:hypothetical protein